MSLLKRACKQAVDFHGGTMWTLSGEVVRPESSLVWARPATSGGCPKGAGGCVACKCGGMSWWGDARAAMKAREESATDTKGLLSRRIAFGGHAGWCHTCRSKWVGGRVSRASSRA